MLRGSNAVAISGSELEAIVAMLVASAWSQGVVQSIVVRARAAGSLSGFEGRGLERAFEIQKVS
jgi:hypothetical protein